MTCVVTDPRWATRHDHHTDHHALYCVMHYLTIHRFVKSIESLRSTCWSEHDCIKGWLLNWRHWHWWFSLWSNPNSSCNLEWPRSKRDYGQAGKLTYVQLMKHNDKLNRMRRPQLQIIPRFLPWIKDINKHGQGTDHKIRSGQIWPRWMKCCKNKWDVIVIALSRYVSSAEQLRQNKITVRWDLSHRNLKHRR